MTTYISNRTLIADGCRGISGQLAQACSFPAIRAAVLTHPDAYDTEDSDIVSDALEYQDEEASAELAEIIEGLEVEGVGTLEWMDGDLWAIEYKEADGACCADCAEMIANGEAPPDYTEEQATELAKACAGYVLACPAEGEDAEFSMSRCDVCGSRLGGDRFFIHDMREA